MRYKVLGISIYIVIRDTRVDKSTKQNHVDKKGKGTLIENTGEYKHLRQAILGHTKCPLQGPRRPYREVGGKPRDWHHGNQGREG